MLKLPDMTDAEYDSLKYVIEFIGGHWNERYKGFIMDDTPDNIYKKLEYIKSSNDIVISSEQEFRIRNQFYPTPSWIAEEMIQRADMRYDMEYDILEPSAGRGALLQYIVQYTASRCTVVEKNKQNAEYLRRLGYKVNNIPFERYAEGTNKKFDRVIMNPPFANEMDLRHTALAFNMLKQGGRLVGLVAQNSLYYDRPVTHKFNQYLEIVGAKLIDLQHGSFVESGTSVDITMIEIQRTDNTIIKL